ncbi:autotransporter outer membrane beta-barrel domain-containing protein, partial [Serratia liquefaciens]|uniref:autotransporter outer membrane beta-barrel domain-containing protein n=1 Tax=Serratia liquefaciens TaxID=614 RepID=UPI003905AD45
FTLTTINPDTGKPTPNNPDNHGTDQGTHKAVVVTKKDSVTGKTIVGLITDTSKTSNATDAVMALASSTQYIFDGEMQALRTRRGDIQRFDQGEGGVWGRYLHNSSDIKAGAGADYSLGQNGMELGGDKVFDVAGGKLSVGVMTSYSKSSVKQRGDSSQVSSYGVGLYSSYLSSVGYYIDGVVKLNHFNNDLRTRTDRGQAVKGSYDQDGYGASLETGYQYTLADGINIDPYVRASYFAAQGKDMELSNGMKAAIGSQKSAKGELGVSVGKAFEVRSMTLSPYITAAVEHEFLKDNKVTFNDRYTYKNDQSGTLGKFGAGMTAQVTKNAQVYVEADYRKGNKVESPIMGNAGFRINF